MYVFFIFFKKFSSDKNIINVIWNDFKQIFITYLYNKNKYEKIIVKIKLNRYWFSTIFIQKRLHGSNIE